MGRYISQPPLTRPLKKQQEFKTSDTFTPSQALLDAGGVVTVRCVGGCGAGGTYAGGSSGMDITRLVTITGPVTVTIGAGGASYPSPSQGGKTTFGTFLAALGGKSPNSGYSGGASSGEGSQAGECAFMVNSTVTTGRGGGGCSGGGDGYSSAALPNTGGGGHQNGCGNGGSGLCIVTWEE